MVVNLGLQGGKRGGRGRMACSGLIHQIIIRAFAKLGNQCGPIRLRNIIICKACVNRIGPCHPRARDAQIFAQATLGAAQDQSAADIWHKADSNLRHGKNAAVAHDTMRGVTAQPNAAAHRIALHEADHRAGEVE